MKITPNRPPAAPHRRRGVGGQGGDEAGGFAPQTDDGPSVPAPAPTAPLTAPGAILALQEVDASEPQARRAVGRGHRVLDELKELHLALVDGWLSEDALHRLAALVDDRRPEVDDADLASLLDDIDLRAAVEMAKLRRRTP